VRCRVCDSDFDGDECPICRTQVDLGEDPERWYDHGRNHWKSGRHGWASRSLERTVELDPKMVKGWIALGIARRDSGEFLTAIECFDRAISVDPADDKAYFNKSMTLSKYGISRDALRVLDTGIEKGGGLVLLLAKGDLLMDLERYEEALDVYNEAMGINPDYKVTLFARQKCLAKLESSRPKERRSLFRRRGAEEGPAPGRNGTERPEPRPKTSDDAPPLIRTRRPVKGEPETDDGESAEPRDAEPDREPREPPTAPDMKEAAADATRRRLFRFRGAEPGQGSDGPERPASDRNGRERSAEKEDGSDQTGQSKHD